MYENMVTLWGIASVMFFTGTGCIAAGLGIVRHAGSVGSLYSSVTGQNEDLRERIVTLQNLCAGKDKTERAGYKVISRAAHDLRTPLNAIAGYSMLLERMSSDPVRAGEYAQKITQAGKTLTELINDVLDMSCIKTGNMKLQEKQYSLRTAMEEVITAVLPQIEERGQIFRYFCSSGITNDCYLGDKQRICQILRNILSNAIKYTPDGGCIEMDMNVAETGDGPVTMTCHIRDTGRGMSSEFRDRLYCPFEREESEDTNGANGLGMGMCIVKSLLDLLGGSISVDSEPGKGSVVSVTIPVIPVRETGPQVCRTALDEEVMRGLRILAAEDNSSNAEILYETLRELGAECIVAENGREAVKIFESAPRGRFDIILMDIQMPVMNGYQAAEAIRAGGHPDAGNILIVAMTADAFEDDVQRAFDSGMNGHIAKPLDLQAFINTIGSLYASK